MKLWGGRFAQGGRDAHFEKFSESFSVDRRLVQYDLLANHAYVQALGAAGVLSGAEVRQLRRGLRAIARTLERNPNRWRTESAEDVHTWVEERLEREVGLVARKLRTGRSRNDLVATETRLYEKSETIRLQSAILELLEALVHQARAHADVVMPGYTHLQPAQPVLFSHYLLAYHEMLARDFDRLESGKRRADELPLGSGALAGAAFPLDRESLARELGFARPTRNSIDATSDRDFLSEFLFCCALTMIHLSRLAEDLIIYSSPGFGYVELADAYSTGSSIMPQKKNPDSLELIRGKAATVLGKLAGTLALLKGLPLAYDRDLQEDKAALFEATDITHDSLVLAARVIATLAVRPSAMAKATTVGFLTATEIADELARRGVAFAQAHEQVGRLVYACLNSTRDTRGGGRGQDRTLGQEAKKPRSFYEISDEEARRYIPSWDPELRKIATSPADAIRRRDVIGGTAPSQVNKQLRDAEGQLAQFKRRLGRTE